MLSPRKEPRRRFTRKEKGKKKMPEHATGNDESDRSRSDSGKVIDFNDASAERLQAAALSSRDNPLAFLDLKDIFGAVSGSGQFQKRFTEALTSLRRDGTRSTLKAYIDGSLAA